MIVTILNFLHRNRFYSLLNAISKLAYFIKGYSFVKSVYHPAFRAYEYRVKGITFLSMGPGWAYNFQYLKGLLADTYGFMYLPKNGDCVIDIGAGLGEETVVFGILTGQSGKVHALEANPSTHAALKYMCERNDFSWVVPHNLAIYKSDGEVTIEDDEENYLINTINTSTSKKAGFTVKAQTFDSFVSENGIKRVDFLKVNIEGAEQFLIEGMSSSVGMVQNMCISCHDFRHIYHNHGEFYLTKQKVIAFLDTQGFKISMRSTGNRVVDDYVYASRH